MRARALAIAFAALAAFASLGPTLRAPEAVPAAKGLRVMTYNVHQYYDESRDRISIDAAAEVIRNADPDIVGLQESNGARITSSNIDGVSYLAHRLGYHAYAAPEGPLQSYGVALLSRFPITASTYVRLPAHESIERYLLLASVSTGNRTLAVGVTHFQTEEFSRDRADEARALVDAVRPLTPLVLLGDFNTRPDAADEAYAVLSAEFVDAWQAIHGAGGATDPASAPQDRIDYVWTRGARVDTVSVAGTARASDHMAVVADLTLPD